MSFYSLFRGEKYFKIKEKYFQHSRSAGVEVRPCGDELAQVVGAEDGGVAGEVVEVVHDDGHEEVDHDEAAEEDEADEVEVGGVAAAALLGVEQLARGVVARVALLVARPPALARQHDVRPRLARRAPASRPGIIASRRGTDGGLSQADGGLL